MKIKWINTNVYWRSLLFIYKLTGFNLPLKITPINGSGSDASEKYKCGSPSCKSLPTCSKEFLVLKNGQFDSCLSACSKFNTDEYCCRGAFGTPDKCVANQYSKSVKAVCPDAYSFAYDDHVSENIYMWFYIYEYMFVNKIVK